MAETILRPQRCQARAIYNPSNRRSRTKKCLLLLFPFVSAFPPPKPIPSQNPLASQQLGSFEPLDFSHRVGRLHEFEDRVAFQDAWNFQKELVRSHLEGNGEDSVVFVEHDPVYTLGTGADEKFVLESDGIEVVRVERGGEVTYHGPGQLTVYLVLDLGGYKRDLHWFVRALEEVVLRAIHKAGIPGAKREDNITGVWIGNKKVGAVGVKVRRWITMHGLAVNVEKSSLRPFGGIVPCGLVGREVGCLNDFIHPPITVSKFAEFLEEALQEVFRIELRRE